jgi:hypothetical protein
MSACSIKGYCHDHGFWHGGEASELRCGIERALAQHGNAIDSRDETEDAYPALVRELEQLLDRIDARDSLAYEEMTQESGLKDSDWPPEEDDDR